MKTSLILLFLFLGLSGKTQDTPMKPSKWLIGLDAGFSIPEHSSCSPCFTDDKDYSLQSYGVLGEYRVLRWLSVRFRLGYNYLRADDFNNDVFREFSPSGGELVLNDRLDGLGLTIGPRLQYRIGQGDLGIEYRHGYALRWLSKSIITPEQEYHIDYQANRTEMSSIRVSYTYWPQPNWAVEFAYEHSLTRSPQPFEPEVPFEETFAGVSHLIVDELQWSHGSHTRASYIYLSFLIRL